MKAVPAAKIVISLRTGQGPLGIRIALLNLLDIQQFIEIRSRAYRERHSKITRHEINAEYLWMNNQS